MPLDQEQQDKLQTLRGDLHNLSGSIKTMTGQLDDQAVLSKLVTGGVKPDYDQFSTQDLQELYDRGVRASAINTLSDGIDPVTQKEIAPPHYHCVFATSLRGEITSELSREQLISGIDAMLENEGYNFDPQRIATAQGLMVNAQAAMIDGGIDRAMLSYIKLQEEVPGFQDKDFESRLKAAKKEAGEFSQLTEKKCSDYVHAGLATKLNQLGARQGDNSTQVQEALEKAKKGLDPTNFSGADKHMQRIQRENLNLSGMNLTGVNLSASNLAGIQTDAISLARADGLDGVQGVEPRLLAEAQAIKPHVARLDDLNERVAKLENKSGVLANLRNLRHGGIDGERKHLEKEIEKAHAAISQAKAGVATQFPAEQNEFEHKGVNVYGVGDDVTRRAEAPKDPRLEATQASVTFRVDSNAAMNDQGIKIAFAKTQIGTKSADLKAAGKSEHEIDTTQMREWNAFGNVAALHGTMGAVNAVSHTNTEQLKTAVGSDITSLLTRSVATSTVDKALGMNSMAEEKIGVDEQGRYVGISVGVPGAPILKRPDSLESNETCLNIGYNNPDVQKGLYDLEAQDYITGQIDRHTGNIFVDPHTGQVSGIDNDLAFPTINREQMIAQSNLSATVITGKPYFLHEDTADKIEALKPEALRSALESIGLPPDVAPLEPAAIDGAVQRLQELQAEIKAMRKEGRIVTKFDNDTYQRALERQQAINPNQPLGTGATVIKTSYLAAAVIEQNKSIGMGQGRDLATKEDIPETQVDANFAAYQQGVQDARADIAANPNQIQDAALAKIITDGQAKLMKLQDQLQTHDQNMTAARARMDQARQDGDMDRAAGLEEIFDNAQQARQETLQELKVEQQKVSAALDHAVEPLKRQIAAQARLATNQVRVNQPQNEVNAGPEVAGNANEQNLEGRVEIPLTPVQAMTAAAIADLNSGTKGLQVFQRIESSPLDPAQKQEVFLALAENIVSESCKNAQEGVGVLRDNTSGTQLMSSYMNAYASEYVDAVGQQMLEAIQNIPLPAEGYSRKGADATLTQDNVPKAGFMNDDEDKMSPELSKQWDDVYFQAGMAAIVAGETQLPKLSPEAQAFLKSCGDTVRKFTPAANADNAAIMVMANTVCLRAGFQTSASDGSALQMKGASVQDKIQGRLLTNASIIAQTYVNTLPKESELGNERPHHKIVNFLREQGLDESRTVMKNLSRGQLPNISPNELAPPDATQKINTAIPDREQRLLAAQGVELPATQATQGVQNTASAPPNVAAESDGAKARVARVGDVLRAASGIKNSVVNALEQKGAEQSLKKVQDKDSKLVQDYKELQNKMSDLKNQYLNAVDATKSLGRSDAEIQTIKDRIDETKKEMDDMKAANKGLAQLDRSKVGQVIHSSVRDAAKAVSNRLK